MRKPKLGGQNSPKEPVFYSRALELEVSQRRKNSLHITLERASLRGFTSLNRRQLERRRGLVECTNLGARRPRGAERSLDTRGFRGLQFQDEILHVWGEKLQCKAIQSYRSALGDRRRVTTLDTDVLHRLALLLHPNGYPKMTFLATSVCSLICS